MGFIGEIRKNTYPRENQRKPCVRNGCFVLNDQRDEYVGATTNILHKDSYSLIHLLPKRSQI